MVNIQAKSLVNLDSLTLKDESGVLWTFKAQGFVGMTPSHLREHRLLAQVLTVRYVETPEGLIISDLTDINPE